MAFRQRAAHAARPTECHSVLRRGPQPFDELRTGGAEARVHYAGHSIRASYSLPGSTPRSLIVKIAVNA